MPDIRFYLSLFFHKIHYFLLFTALGAVIGITLALVLPTSYWAQARLLVESEQIPDELAASTVQTMAAEQLQIIQQRIMSRENLLEMANRLNIYRPIPGQPVLDLRPDEKVEDLRRRIWINVTGADPRRQEATIVNVGFSAGSAELAAQVTNEVVSMILQENVRMRTGVSGQTLEFFQQSVDRLDEELSRKGAQILEFQKANEGALPDSLEFRRSQLAAAQERLMQVEREQIALKERRQGLVNLYESTGRTTLQASAQETTEEAQLRRLREQYATSLAVMSMENPRIKVMQSQIDALEKIVAEQAAERSGQQIGANGEMLSPYEIQLADLDNQLEFLETRQAQIEGEIAALQEAIEATPANTITLQTLQRDYDNIRTQYDQAVANRARAETGDIIESLSKGQRISVIEQAVTPQEPSNPNRPKLIVAGIGGGMMIGIGLIVLLEFLSNAVRRPVDITSKLDIVPFATLSFIRTKREIWRRRMLIAGAFLVVLAGIPATLWAIDVYYMPLDLLLEEFMRKLPIMLAQIPSARTLT